MAEAFFLTVQVSAVESNTDSTITRETNHTVTVQEEAKLNLTADITAPNGATDRIVSTHQQFEVKIGITNDGEANTTDSSEVTVSLPVEFSFSKTIPDTQEIVNIIEDDSTMLIVYSDTLPHGLQTIKIRITEPANDRNTNSNATMLDSVANIQNIRTVRRADLTLDTLSTPPATVAQNETFDISTIVRNLGQAGITEDSVRVVLRIDGSGLTLSGDSARFRALNDSIVWRINSAPESSINTITVHIDSMQDVRDENNDYQDTLVYVSNPIQQYSVEVINQTPVQINNVYMTSRTDSLSRDIIVSTDQENIYLDVKATFNQVYSQLRRASLRLPSGVSLTDTLQKDFTSGTDLDSVRWKLTATAFPKARFPIYVDVEAVSSFNDTTVTDTVYMTVLAKGVLSLSAEITAPLGARDGIVSYGQEFTVTTSIFNSGAASTITDSGTVKLIAGDTLLIKVGEEYLTEDSRWYTLSDKNAEIEWTILAADNPQLTQLLTQIGDLKTEKKILLQQSVNKVLEEGASFTHSAVREIENQIHQLGSQLENYLITTGLLAILDTIPDDVYTGLPADTAQGSDYIEVEILPEAEFEVDNVFAINVEDSTVINTLSTNQTFLFRAIVNTSEQVDDTRLAKLEFPDEYASQTDGFRFAEFEVEKLFSGDSVSWLVQAPDIGLISEPTPIDSIKIKIRSFDVNTGIEISDSFYTSLTVEKEAILGLSLRISDPPNAEDGRLAPRQEFTLAAIVSKSGDAEVSDSGSIELTLDPDDGIQIIDGLPGERTFNWPDSTVDWRLRMPDSLITSNIRANFTLRPNDVNKAAPATLDPLNSVGSISVSTEDKIIVVTPVEGIEPINTINRGGDSNIPMIGLRVSNEDASDIDVVLIDSVVISLIDGNGDPLEGSPDTYLESIRIANYAASGLNLTKVFNQPQEFADYTLPSLPAGEFIIPFDSTLRLTPEQVDSLVFFVDLKSSAPNSSFIFEVANIFAYLGAQRSPVTVVDGTGANFINSTQGRSKIVSILSGDTEDQFSNYPNPFGENGGTTSFVFYMEQPGEAEIKIYTLMGGLVWSERKTLDGPQVHDGAFKWDGINNAGNRVLNGVYIAILNVNGQTLKTKVAYIK